MDEIGLVSVTLRAVPGKMPLLPTIEACIAIASSLGDICSLIEVSEPCWSVGLISSTPVSSVPSAHSGSSYIHRYQSIIHQGWHIRRIEVLLRSNIWSPLEERLSLEQVGILGIGKTSSRFLHSSE